MPFARRATVVRCEFDVDTWLLERGDFVASKIATYKLFEAIVVEISRVDFDYGGSLKACIL